MLAFTSTTAAPVASARCSFHNTSFSCTTRPTLQQVQTLRRRTPKCVAAGSTAGHREDGDAAAASAGGSGGRYDDHVIWETVSGCTTALPRGTPAGIVHLLGGLGACAAPEKFYSRLARSLCTQANVAVICVPLRAVPGLNHRSVSAEATSRTDKVIHTLRERYGNTLGTIALGHSLGARLQVISSCTRSNDIAAVLLSFSNTEIPSAVPGASTAQQALNDGVATKLGDALRYTLGKAADTLDRELGAKVGSDLRAQADIAAQGVEAAGTAAAQALGDLKFEPTATQLLTDIRQSYSVPRTLVVRFDRDSIDSSAQLIPALHTRFGAQGTIARVLPGTHVTPMAPQLSDQMPTSGNTVVDSTIASLRDGVDSEFHSLLTCIIAFVRIVLAAPSNHPRVTGATE